MALYGNHAQVLPLTDRFSGGLGQGNREAALAEPSAPNRKPARRVAGQRVRERKANKPKIFLPCPVCVGNPGWYSKVKHKCSQGATYEGLSKLIEHINRVHSEEFLCPICIRTIPVHEKGCTPVKNREEYPTFLTNDVVSKVRKWSIESKDSATPRDSNDLVVGRWKLIFKLIHSREPMIHELAAFSQSPSSQSTSSQSPSSQSPSSQSPSSQPVSSQLAFSQLAFSQLASSQLAYSQLASSQLASSQLASSQLASPQPVFQPPAPRQTKRQASSSPHGKPSDPRRRQTNSQVQAADKGAGAVEFGLAPGGLKQPQPDGHRDVPFGRQPHGTIDPRELYSPYSFDKPNRDIDPTLLDNTANPSTPGMRPTYAQSWDWSETTAVTGPVPNAYAGSTVWSETSGFYAYKDLPMTMMSYVQGDGDDLFSEFNELDRDMVLGCQQQEGRSVTAELVPGARYVETLEGEADADLLKLTE